MVGYSGLIDSMWISVFGGSNIIAAIALFVLFIILCFRQRLEPQQAGIVMMPLVLGLTTDNSVPPWIKNVFIMGIMALIAIAIIKYFGER